MDQNDLLRSARVIRTEARAELAEARANHVKEAHTPQLEERRCAWAVDQPCELMVRGKWLATTVHELDALGHPRVRNPSTGKVVSVGPGKLLRSFTPKVVKEAQDFHRVKEAQDFHRQKANELREALQTFATDATAASVADHPRDMRRQAVELARAAADIAAKAGALEAAEEIWSGSW